MFENDYGSQVGTLGYLRRTRPDLCVALGVSAQFAKIGRHGPPHYRALRNIMRYCKLTKHHGIVHTSSHKKFRDPWDLSANVDSDWASWKATRRSRAGCLIYLNRNLIAFGSRQFAVDDLTEVWLPRREEGEQERHRAEAPTTHRGQNSCAL